LSANGTKTWVLRYRHRRLERRLKLGTCPAMKLADARQPAVDTKVSVEKGDDAFADRLRDKSAKSFAGLAEYVTRHAIQKKKTRLQLRDRARLARIQPASHGQVAGQETTTRSGALAGRDPEVSGGESLNMRYSATLRGQMFQMRQRLPPERTKPVGLARLAAN
jgi:hypothetical protein